MNMNSNVPDGPIIAGPRPGGQQPSPKRLTRSRDQRMFLGVCGGLGEYFDLDPTLVRLIFVVAVLLGGSGLLVYAVLALIMPNEAEADLDPRLAAQHTLDEAGQELERAANWTVEKVRSVFGSRREQATEQTWAPPASSSSPDAETARMPPADMTSPDAGTTSRQSNTGTSGTDHAG
jgi:phage shock protein C